MRFISCTIYKFYNYIYLTYWNSSIVQYPKNIIFRKLDSFRKYVRVQEAEIPLVPLHHWNILLEGSIEQVHSTLPYKSAIRSSFGNVVKFRISNDQQN
jgi:hypothetical protein